MEETTDTTTTTSAVTVRVSGYAGDSPIDRHEGADDFLSDADGVLTVYASDGSAVAVYAPTRWISAVIEKKDA